MSAVTHWLELYGYWAIFFIIFLEDFGLPLPGETVLITAALLASQGKMDLFLLIAVAWLAAVLGDNAGYALGRYGGQRLILRYGKYVWLTPRKLNRIKLFFGHYGVWLILGARFVDILRQLNGIVAGLTGMRWGTFLSANASGALLWTGFWSVLAFCLGKELYRYHTSFSRIVLLLLPLLLIAGSLAAVIRYWLKKQDKPHGR